MSNISDKPWLVPGHMYQYDIGWLVDKLLSFETELDTAIDLKTIHYADPIQWDITTQYAPNTVVVDPKTGTAYMSKVPVPSGILLTNTDYWVVIFNYQRIYDKIMSGVAFNDKDNLNASKDLLVNDLVWYRGDLYRATRDISQGSTYIPGTNLAPTTIADCLATYYGRDRVANVINDTVNVSRDYTLNAANIAETSSNRTVNASGDYTLNAGDIAETSANRTIKTTADYHIDVDGNLSDNVDGVTTVNRGGAVTEAYGSSLDVGVTGTYTERSTNKIVDASTEVHNADTFSITKNLKYKTPIAVNDFYNKVPFIGQDGNTYNLMSATGRTEEITRNLGKSEKLCVVAIGDSYALGGDNYGNWIDPFRTALGLTNNVDFYSNADGGAGFSQNGTNTNLNFEGLLVNLSNSIQDKGAVTKVICAGGYNDDNVKTENVKSFVNKARILFPNAEVYIACIARSTDMGKNLRIANDILPTYQIGANIAGAIYITNSESCNHDYSQMGDSIHPNQTLSNYIGRCLAQGIKTGSCDVNSGLSQINFRPINNTLHMGAWYEKLHNNNVIIIGSVIYFGQNEPIQPNTNIDIAEVDSKYLLGVDGINLIYFNIPGYFSDGANHFWNGSACFGIRNKKLILKSFTINRDGSAFEPTLKQFTGEFGTMILDSIYC